MSQSIRPTISGSAQVFCVHDREKRLVTHPSQVWYLGAIGDIVYDAKKHKIHNCACCQNLFVSLDDTPTLCQPCTTVPMHTLEAPLPEPEGVIDG